MAQNVWEKKKCINIKAEVLVFVFHIDVRVRGKTQTARQVALT